MWCAQCNQHVAGLVGDAGGATLCASCGTEIDAFADLLPGKSPAGTTVAERSKTRGTPAPPVHAPYLAASRMRLDQIGRRLDALAVQPRTRRDMGPATAQQPAALEKGARNWFGAAGLFLGTAAFACGAALAGWSLYAGRAELWNIGLPTAIFGQLLLWGALASQCDFLRPKNSA